jgi:hypothetical protein
MKRILGSIRAAHLPPKLLDAESPVPVVPTQFWAAAIFESFTLNQVSLSNLHAQEMGISRLRAKFEITTGAHLAAEAR